MERITGAGSADLIAYAWYKMGYRPSNSIVLVGLRIPPEGGKQQFGMVARIDWPQQALLVEAIESVSRTLAEHGHVGLVAVIDSRHRSRAARAIRKGGRRAGLEVLDVLGVGGTHYRSYLCRSTSCCPAAGLPISDVENSRVAAAMVLNGVSLLPDEAALLADVTPDAVPDLTEEVLASRPTMTRRQALDLWRELTGGLEATGPGRGRIPRQARADLLLALDDVVFRDAVLVSAAAPAGSDRMALARLVLAGRSARAFERLRRSGPDDAALRRAGQVISWLARTAVPGRRAEALAALAWWAWWQGNGVRARMLAERSLADRADQRLACLMLEVLACSVAPGWATGSSRPTRQAAE